MNRPIRVWMAFLGVLLLGAPAGAQWMDSFDTYSTGTLTTQSSWELWDLTPGVDCDVTTAGAFTPANGVRVDNADDVIYDFVNEPGGRPSSGTWIFSIKTYVPASASGTGFVIMLNEYTHNGPKNWSRQFRFDANAGTVKVDGQGGGATANIKWDEWVTLMACINLDDDVVDVYYGASNLLKDGSWKDGQSGGGSSVIAVLDLYGGGGNGIDEFYLDNPRLDPAGGKCLSLSSSPNPISAGQNLRLISVGRAIPNGSLGAIMSWTVDDALFIKALLFPFYGFGNRFTVNATIPPGLSGLRVGLKSLAAPGSGGLQLSNEDVIVFN